MTSLLHYTPYLFLAQTDYETENKGVGPVLWIIYCAVLILTIAGMWRVFTKAGQPGWAVLIPIFNLYVLCKAAGRPGWWVILMLIPLINLLVLIIIQLRLVERFGKNDLFTLGLVLLPFIFWPILGFGSAQYQGAQPATV